MQALLVAQPRDIGLGKPNRQVGCLAVVAATKDFAVPINPRQGLAVSQRDVQPDRAAFACEPPIDKR